MLVNYIVNYYLRVFNNTLEELSRNIIIIYIFTLNSEEKASSDSSSEVSHKSF